MKNVGMFGVVDSLASNTVNGTNTYIGNFGLSGITVEAKNKDAIVGVVAGDLDGELENIAVDSPTLNIVSANSSHSDYMMVGRCDSKYQRTITKVDEDLYDLNIAKYDFVVQDGGYEAGWGGPVDMKSMHGRLAKLKASGDSVSYNNYPYRKTTTHNANGSTSQVEDKTVYGSGNDTRGVKKYTKTNTNKKIGSVIQGNRDSDQYLYLMGGYKNIDNYYEYCQAVSYYITSDSSHYLNATYNYNDETRANLSNATSSGNSVQWTFEYEGDLAKI